MRLKLLSPGEMNEDQKQTYDESIAGKRGAPPPPMMAWLNSPEMARHATRLGGFLRFDTLFPAKLSEIAILVTARHWTSQGHGVSKALYDEAVKLLTERGLVEIIGLCGYYTMVSMTLNTFEFELPAGEVSELA